MAWGYIKMFMAVEAPEQMGLSWNIEFGSRKGERPTKRRLKQLIASYSFVAIGKMFKVSDNAIRLWRNDYNLGV